MISRRSLLLGFVLATPALAISEYVLAKPKRKWIGGGGDGTTPPDICPDPGAGFANIINVDGNYLTNADGNCIAAKI